jgi:hypothetical protein
LPWLPLHVFSDEGLAEFIFVLNFYLCLWVEEVLEEPGTKDGHGGLRKAMFGPPCVLHLLSNRCLVRCCRDSLLALDLSCCSPLLHHTDCTCMPIVSRSGQKCLEMVAAPEPATTLNDDTTICISWR